MSALKYWVWLSTLTDLKPKTRAELVRAFESPEEVYFADVQKLARQIHLSESEREALVNKDVTRADEILRLCSDRDIALITIGDAAYPKRLKGIFDPPVLLYVRGRLPRMDEEAAIGIVGTRKATPYGIKMGRKMGFEITKGGGLVVTGLAAGVDSAAAEGALRAGGSCVGVLGCAIDDVFPVWNTALYDDVAAVGALVSEYPPGTPIMSKNFPERNRIMSGLSVGVTVIEAPFFSGALITASRALDQGREVFAVPGNADASNCFGSNALIREGAQLVTCGWDVLEEFEGRFPNKVSQPDAKKLDALLELQEEGPELGTEKIQTKLQKHPAETGRGFAKLRVASDRKKVDTEKKREYIDLREQLKELTEPQLKIVSAMDQTGKHVDDIIDKSGLSAHIVLSELTILQIKGFVSQASGKRFSLNIKN